MPRKKTTDAVKSDKPKKPRKPRAKKAVEPAQTESKTKVKLLGYFWVDSGTVSIGDPCYLSGRENPFKAWGAFCDKMFGKDTLIVGEEEGAGTQVTFRTPDGDGKFPVYGVYENDVLVRVTISFGKKSEVK